MPKKYSLFTIGHSNRSLEDFLEILAAHEIACLIDVRTMPMSRRVPWSNKPKLATTLSENKINYLHMPELGGMRKTSADSINLGWKNASFRGYADYMQTEEFYLALQQLNQQIKKNKKVVIMCAEALPWKCHRSLIADAEVARGVSVFHIFDKKNLKPHEITAFAQVDKTHNPIIVFYPKAK